MQKVKCISKIRDTKGKITGYIIQSSTGETRDVDKDRLKEAVRNKKIDIVNMTLTSDNRLIDKKIKDIKSGNEISSHDRKTVEEIKQMCTALGLPFDANEIKRSVDSGSPVITYSANVPFGVDTVGIHISRVNNKEWDLCLDIDIPGIGISDTNKDAWIKDAKEMLALVPKPGQKPSIKTLMKIACAFIPYTGSLAEDCYVDTLFGYAKKTGQSSDLSRYINSVKKQLNTEGVHKVINKYIDKLENSANPQDVNDIKDYPMTPDDVIAIFALYGYDTEYFDKNPKIVGSTLEQKVASAIKFNHGDLEPASVDIALCTARKYMSL